MGGYRRRSRLNPVRLEQPVVLDDPPLFITLLQSLAKNEKMDLVVAGGGAGCFRIIPVITNAAFPAGMVIKDGDGNSMANHCPCRVCPIPPSRIPEVKPPVDFLQALAAPAPEPG